MRPFLALIKKEALLLRRDIHGLALLFILPATFITIMSLALQGAHELGGEKSSTKALALDLDDTHTSSEFLSGLSSNFESFSFKSVTASQLNNNGDDLRDQFVEALKSESYQLGLIVPAGFHQALMNANDRSPAKSLEVYYSPRLPPQTHDLFSITIQGALDMAVLTAALESLAPAWGEQTRTEILLDDQPFAVKSSSIYGNGSLDAVPNAVQQSVPAWLVFAMFFIVSPLASSFIIERDQGTLDRLRQMNLSIGLILASRFPVYYAVNMTQMAIMLAVGYFVVPALGGEQLSLGTSPFGLLLVATSISIAALGFAMLIACLATTVMQATLLGGVVIILLAAIGGIMVPKVVMPTFMQQLAEISPMSWGLEGFWAVLLHHEGWESVLPHSLSLILFGATCWALASLLFYRKSLYR
ncbi:ABC transporter permease [Halorhodospira halochloris]|uniref:ABC transporter permease n=1 Tax=Halorhodospira halochloris TaxID=1052 RepID=UPI001EE8715B|nr:ABC transporter permease [Halorhodospira halochloris]MCG5529930.1 ABC transporter permease [Halorhodospira halochloris]